MRRARGVALLLVMWLVMLLAALVGAFALAARIESLQGHVLTHGVVAEGAARAGLEYALVRIGDPDPQRRWIPDGRSIDWEYGGAVVRLKLEDEAGKIDLNQADQGLLSGLFGAVGVAQAQAAQLAAAIVDWRDGDVLTQPAGGAEDRDYAAAGLEYGAKDAPFDTVAELQQVLGMTPDLFRLVEPHLSVHARLAQPRAELADEVVRRAMGAPAQVPGAAAAITPSGTYRIHSRARLANGREAFLSAIARPGNASGVGSAYTALQWSTAIPQEPDEQQP